MLMLDGVMLARKTGTGAIRRPALVRRTRPSFCTRTKPSLRSLRSAMLTAGADTESHFFNVAEMTVSPSASASRMALR